MAIEVQLDQTGVPVGEGYQLAVLGDSDADVDMLVAEVRSKGGGRVLPAVPTASPASSGLDGG